MGVAQGMESWCKDASCALLDEGKGDKFIRGFLSEAWSAASDTVGSAHSLGFAHLDFDPLFIFSKKN